MHLLLLNVALVGVQIADQSDGDAARADRLFAEKVIASTTAEWSPVFSRQRKPYVAPRVLFFEPARRHPARGFGYSRQVGLAVDLGEMKDVRSIFKRDSDILIALIIAHEVSHHVQYLVERSSRYRHVSVNERELEADCGAGWWLRRANQRSMAATGVPLYSTETLSHRLPQLFGVLAQLNGSVTTYSAPNRLSPAIPASTRMKAFNHGLETDDIKECGPGIVPRSTSG